MSKSTPISQIPTTNILEQRDVSMDEDDATVQEVLNQIAQSMSGSEDQLPPTPPHPPIPQPPPQHYQTSHQNQIQQHPPHQHQPQHHYQPPSPPPPSATAVAPTAAVSPTSTTFVVNLEDVRTVVVVAIICIVVQMVPIEEAIFKYVPSARNVPYASVVIKGLAAGGVYLVANKYGII
jgi:hypothetical protein